MLGTSELVAFVGCANLETSHRFYADVLGLQETERTSFANVYSVAGTQLRVTAVPEPAAAGYTVLGFRVADLETTVAQLEAAAVELQRFDGTDQDERGIWTAPSGARIAWFGDPDGNVLSIQQDPS